MVFDISKIPQMPSIAVGKYSGVVMVIFEIVVTAAICILVYWFITYRKKFNINVVIRAKRGDDILIGYDKGGFFNIKGERKFKLLKRKKELAPPDFQYINLTEKGNSEITYYKLSESDYHPVEFLVKGDEPKFIPVEADIENWLASEQRANFLKYSRQTFWEKYGTLVGIGLVVMLIIVTTWIIWGKAELIANSLASASDKLAEALRYAGAQTLK